MDTYFDEAKAFIFSFLVKKTLGGGRKKSFTRCTMQESSPSCIRVETNNIDGDSETNKGQK